MTIRALIHTGAPSWWDGAKRAYADFDLAAYDRIVTGQAKL